MSRRDCVQVIPAYPPGGDTSSGSFGNGRFLISTSFTNSRFVRCTSSSSSSDTVKGSVLLPHYRTLEVRPGRISSVEVKLRLWFEGDDVKGMM